MGDKLRKWMIVLGMTFAFEFVSFLFLVIHDEGLHGTYHCTSIDVTVPCSFSERVLNSMLLMNLFFGLPTIIFALISYLLYKIWTEGVRLS